MNLKNNQKKTNSGLLKILGTGMSAPQATSLPEMDTDATFTP
jgi:hypothetical protein